MISRCRPTRKGLGEPQEALAGAVRVGRHGLCTHAFLLAHGFAGARWWRSHVKSRAGVMGCAGIKRQRPAHSYEAGCDLRQVQRFRAKQGNAGAKSIRACEPRRDIGCAPVPSLIAGAGSSGSDQLLGEPELGGPGREVEYADADRRASESAASKALFMVVSP
jgi:hypothetical protein